MKKSVILAVMAMLLGFTFTSCKEDTQPRLSTPTNFVLIWAYKGGQPTGGSIGDYRNLYPLPSQVLSGYGSSMQQNPGY